MIEYILKIDHLNIFGMTQFQKTSTLQLKLILKKGVIFPKNGKLIVIANHAFGVADGVSICSVISKVRQDYKMVTHKVLRQADAVKNKNITN